MDHWTWDDYEGGPLCKVVGKFMLHVHQNCSWKVMRYGQGTRNPEASGQENTLEEAMKAATSAAEALNFVEAKFRRCSSDGRAVAL